MYDLSKVVTEAEMDEHMLAKVFNEQLDEQTSHVAKLVCLIYIPFMLAWGLYSRSGGSGSDKVYVGLLCYSWVAMSLGMHILNKMLVTFLNMPCFITVVQMAMAALFMTVCHGRRIQNCIKQHRDQALRWLIVPCVFSGMLISSIFTFKYMSLSVMTVVRNLAPMLALPVEYLVMAPQNRPAVTASCLGALGIMLAGAVIYGFSAPVVTGIGLAFAVMNMCLAITDRMLQRKLLAQDCQDLRLEVCTFINNFVGMAPSLAVSLITHEMSNVQPHHVSAWWRADVVLFLMLSGFVGIGMCYFGLAVQRSISATSFLVLNNMSKFAVVGIGVALFGDPIKSNYTKAGLLLSLGGSCWYGWSQISAGLKEGAPAVQKPLMAAVRAKLDSQTAGP
jgi:drug/metabolite transporter (DMT)-like permease